MLAFRDKILRYLPGLSLNLLRKFEDWPSMVREIAGTNHQTYTLESYPEYYTMKLYRSENLTFLLTSDVVSDIRLEILIGIRQVCKIMKEVYFVRT
jgi:hypothetical protein